ncbi:hypothetical protein TNCV_349921 [Trichonephila clavipes]|nr:hypothetical protein TNCV_349921 [Trichonephila clavipes]
MIPLKIEDRPVHKMAGQFTFFPGGFWPKSEVLAINIVYSALSGPFAKWLGILSQIPTDMVQPKGIRTQTIRSAAQ